MALKITNKNRKIATQTEEKVEVFIPGWINTYFGYFTLIVIGLVVIMPFII